MIQTADLSVHRGQSFLCDLSVWHQHGELRAPLIYVYAHMCHRCVLLPPGGMSFCASLFPDSEGGQRSYSIKWLRVPPTMNDEGLPDAEVAANPLRLPRSGERAASLPGPAITDYDACGTERRESRTGFASIQTRNRMYGLRRRSCPLWNNAIRWIWFAMT